MEVTTRGRVEDHLSRCEGSDPLDAAEEPQVAHLSRAGSAAPLVHEGAGRLGLGRQGAEQPGELPVSEQLPLGHSHLHYNKHRFQGEEGRFDQGL